MPKATFVSNGHVPVFFHDHGIHFIVGSLALAEVAESQAVFDMKDVTGSIVGFRSPPFVKGINVPGYHLHFLSDDRTQGGHILDFDMDQAVCHMDVLDRFFMILPENGEGLEGLDLAEDRAKELKKVEQ